MWTSKNWNKNVWLTDILAHFLYLLMDAEQKTKYKCIWIHWKKGDYMILHRETNGLKIGEEERKKEKYRVFGVLHK